MSSKKISVKTERFYSAHHALLRIARDNLTKAETKEPGWFDWQFSTITFSSLAIEAFCNAFGEKVIRNWNDFESCSPKVKLRLICEHLDISYDSSKEPWLDVLWLLKIRNLIAHPKAEPLKSQTVMSQEDHAKQHRSFPKSKLESEFTLKNAQKSVWAVNQLIELFCAELTSEQNFGIVGDMSSSVSTLHDDAK